MITEQIEIGIALMIKTCIGPVSGVVASFALFPVTTFVLVIRCVAAEAVCRRARKCPVLVTIQAGSLAMFTEQRIVSFVVIEFGFQPFGWLVAGATFSTHDFLMGLIFKMAVDALRRCFPMLQLRCMTIRTIGICVWAFQVEVGKAVVKGLLIHDNDDGIATFVFGMARSTLVILYFCTESMKACFLFKVCCDLFMTIQAQLTLPFLVK